MPRGSPQTTGPGASEKNRKTCTCQSTGRGPTLHLPVFRPEPSETAFCLLHVLSPSSAGSPGEAGAHTITRSHRPRSYALASLRTGAFENDVFCRARPLPLLRELSRRAGGIHKNMNVRLFCSQGALKPPPLGGTCFRCVAMGPADHHLPGTMSICFETGSAGGAWLF